MLAAVGDVGLDTANYVQQQGQDQPSLRSMVPGLLAGAAIWGSWGLSKKLEGDPFRKAHDPLLRQMGRFGSVAERRAVATSYFARNAQKVERLSNISKASVFANKAESSYLRRAASVGLKRFANTLNTAFFIAPALFGATYHGFRGIKKLGYELQTPNMGGHFVLNASQATERQRAIQAMHDSEFNGRSAMGNEAALYHQ